MNVYYQPPQQLKRAQINGVSSDSPRLTFAGQVGHMPAKILFDIGATGTANINPKCCKRLGLHPRPFQQLSNKQLRRLHRIQRLACAAHCTIDPTEFSQTLSDAGHKEAVLLADGTSLPALRIVDVPITIQGYKETIRYMVIDLSDNYNIILCDSWLYEHVGVIDYHHGHIRVVSRGCEVTLRTESAVTSAQQPTWGQFSHPTTSPTSAYFGHLCSLGYAQQGYQRGAPLHLVLIHRAGDLLEGDAPGVPDFSARQLAPISDSTAGQSAPSGQVTPE